MLYTFGFIVAATLGCTAGSVDLTEGMFRHLVVTGRSRLALYLARIPAGLAIIVPLVAIGFSIVCAVCVFAAPTKLNLQRPDRARRPVAQRTRELGRRPRHRRSSATCPLTTLTVNVDCGPVGQRARRGRHQDAAGERARPHAWAELRAAAVQIADQNYACLPASVPVPAELADDQDRAVARARSRRSDSSSASASDRCSGNAPSPSS